MRKAIIALATAGAVMLPTAAFAHSGCYGTNHKHTRSGGCKDTADANQRDPSHKARAWDLHCGSSGQITEVGGVHVYGNSDSEGGELEACSDSGAGNQQGRVIAQGSTANQGGRLILDSDIDQEPASTAGYILVQVAASKPGVWCTTNAGTANARGDGYAAPWSNPGPDGGLGPDAVNCLPGV